MRSILIFFRLFFSLGPKRAKGYLVPVVPVKGVLNAVKGPGNSMQGAILLYDVPGTRYILYTRSTILLVHYWALSHKK